MVVTIVLVLGAVLVAVGVGTAIAAAPDGPTSGDRAAAGPSVAGSEGHSGLGPNEVDAAHVSELVGRLEGPARRAEAQRRADADLHALAVASEMAAAAEAFEQARAALGLPPDSYWDRMATCETGGNWAMTGSRYSGGVGFANSTWAAYGGREFAANAGHASREQQIIVANRVATQGYGGVAPAGYSAWGCTAHVGRP